MALDTNFANSEKAVETLILDAEIAKGGIHKHTTLRNKRRRAVSERT